MNERMKFTATQTSKQKITTELVMSYYKKLKKWQEGRVLFIILTLLQYIMKYIIAVYKIACMCHNIVYAYLKD